MPEMTAEQFAHRAFEVNLLDPRQLDAIWGEFGTRDVSFDDFKSLLLRKEIMTNYQVERIISGERTGYFYGDHKVLYIAGVGTFARVYRAVNRLTNKVVAIKALRKRYRDDPSQTEQFLREGQMGATLHHPNVVPIYEVHGDRRQPYLVMEFVEGRSLREFTKIRRKLEPLESVKLAKDITAGLAYAAERHITHRDLKMSNILVTSKGSAKVLDFGLAAAMASTNDDDVADNPNPRAIDYAALERATGVRRDDPRSDIYFVGCIFYNMLTGVAPLYETRDRLLRLNVQRFHDIKPIIELEPDLPRIVAVVVNKAMELNPDRRYGTMRELNNDLEIAYQRLLAGDTGADLPLEPTASPVLTAPSMEGVGKTVMLIEANAGMQDLVREKLKSHGYRVLIVSDPQRGMSRFVGAQHVADCVIFSALGLGDAAVTAFNAFSDDDATREIPALLLLDRKQQALAKSAKLAPHRQLLSLPLKVKELRLALIKLLRQETPAK